MYLLLVCGLRFESVIELHLLAELILQRLDLKQCQYGIEQRVLNNGIVHELLRTKRSCLHRVTILDCQLTGSKVSR